MGCLFEIIFELVFEVIVEGVFMLYVKLMTLFIPEHQFSPLLRERIKKGVTAFAAILLLIAFIGVILFIQPPSVIKTIGAFMMFIPIGVIAAQIVAGIVYRIVKVLKSRQ
jgi:hypothetical protein